VDAGSACVDIRQSPKTDDLFKNSFSIVKWIRCRFVSLDEHCVSLYKQKFDVSVNVSH